MTPRWTCVIGHQVEAETEEELVRKVQEHMRQDHGMEISRDRILRDGPEHLQAGPSGCDGKQGP